LIEAFEDKEINMSNLNSAAVPAVTKTAPSRFFDPGHLFERIIRSWGANSVLRPEPGPVETTYMPMERMTLLTGTLQGTLVLRSSLEFSAWLRNQRSDTALGRYSEEEIFEEMVSLFCLYLYHDFWNPDSFRIGPIHPFRSVPRDWPKENAQVSCSLSVEGHPVEIRLWLEAPVHS
jgi:hypothetical protein